MNSINKINFNIIKEIDSSLSINFKFIFKKVDFWNFYFVIFIDQYKICIQKFQKKNLINRLINYLKIYFIGLEKRYTCNVYIQFHLNYNFTDSRTDHQ